MAGETNVLIQATRLRATLIDECGAPLAGACSTIVTKGIISLAVSYNVEAGSEYKQKLGSGELNLSQRGKPELNWAEIKLAMAGVDPVLISFLTGGPLVYDDTTPTPIPIGWGVDSDQFALASVAIELWTNVGKRRGAPSCPPGGRRYGYTLLPWLVEGTIEDHTFEDGPVNLTVDAITCEGNDWGVGPYDVLLDRLGATSPLIDALPTTRHHHTQFTSLAPPEPTDGCVPLVLAS